MNIRPLADRVLVKPFEPTLMTPSGLVLPEAHAEAPCTGTVLAVGPDVSQVVVGDYIFYKAYAGHLLTDGSLMMVEDEVLLVLDP